MFAGIVLVLFVFGAVFKPKPKVHYTDRQKAKEAVDKYVEPKN